MQGNKDQYEKWNFQSPPTSRHQKGKPVYSFGRKLPNFGPFMEEKREKIAIMKATARTDGTAPKGNISNGSSEYSSSSPSPTHLNLLDSTGKVPRIKVGDLHNPTYSPVH